AMSGCWSFLVPPLKTIPSTSPSRPKQHPIRPSVFRGISQSRLSCRQIRKETVAGPRSGGRDAEADLRARYAMPKCVRFRAYGCSKGELSRLLKLDARPEAERPRRRGAEARMLPCTLSARHI